MARLIPRSASSPMQACSEPGVCGVTNTIIARCKREGVKVLYEQEIDGQKLKICKNCKATLANKKKVAVAK